jgi:hypothetical protein
MSTFGIVWASFFLFWSENCQYSISSILLFSWNAMLSHIAYDIWYIRTRQTPFSQLIRYSRVCSYQDFLNRGLLLTRNPRNQGFLLELKSSLRNYYGRHLLDMEYQQYHKWQCICSTWRIHFPIFSYIHDLSPAL